MGTLELVEKRHVESAAIWAKTDETVRQGKGSPLAVVVERKAVFAASGILGGSSDGKSTPTQASRDSSARVVFRGNLWTYSIDDANGAQGEHGVEDCHGGERAEASYHGTRWPAEKSEDKETAGSAAGLMESAG